MRPTDDPLPVRRESDHADFGRVTHRGALRVPDNMVVPFTVARLGADAAACAVVTRRRPYLPSTLCQIRETTRVPGWSVCASRQRAHLPTNPLPRLESPNTMHAGNPQRTLISASPSTHLHQAAHLGCGLAVPELDEFVERTADDAPPVRTERKRAHLFRVTCQRVLLKNNRTSATETSCEDKPSGEDSLSSTAHGQVRALPWSGFPQSCPPGLRSGRPRSSPGRHSIPTCSRCACHLEKTRRTVPPPPCGTHFASAPLASTPANPPSPQTNYEGGDGRKARKMPPSPYYHNAFPQSCSPRLRSRRSRSSRGSLATR